MSAAEICDVVVLGLGGMGAAALRHLAKKGLRAVGIEQHDIAHARGSSHGSSRVIRKAYFEDARYVPILRRSYELWHELEREAATTLYTRTGCLNLGPRDHEDMRSLERTVRAHALPHELLDAAGIRARFPAFRVDDDTAGVFEEDAGILHPERCTAAHVARAVHDGATVYAQERVTDVCVGAQGVEVRTERRTLACGHVVVCMGPWLPALLSDGAAPNGAGLAAVAGLASIARATYVTRQPQLWFASPSDAYAMGAFPVFIQFPRATNAGDDAPATYYGMPPLAGDGVKVCRHGGGARTNPEAIDREVRAADVDDVRGYLRRALPALVDAPVVRGAVCMYTMTPDAHFVVGAVDERVVVLGGFSGHGYKMASALGEIASELVVDGRARLDIALFDPARLTAAR